MEITDATAIVLEDLMRGYPGLDKDTGGSHRVAAMEFSRPEIYFETRMADL